MAEPKHKLREVKKKTFIDRLVGSALFILFMIIVFIVDVVTFLVWLSQVLSSKIQGSEIFTAFSFILFVTIAVFITGFILIAWLLKRAGK